jgi:hypothetical protein
VDEDREARAMNENGRTMALIFMLVVVFCGVLRAWIGGDGQGYT